MPLRQCLGHLNRARMRNGRIGPAASHIAMRPDRSAHVAGDVTPSPTHPPATQPNPCASASQHNHGDHNGDDVGTAPCKRTPSLRGGCRRTDVVTVGPGDVAGFGGITADPGIALPTVG